MCNYKNQLTNKGLLVSIIIPVYNVKPYISEAIESVIHQTYNNLEIIIIDDGSTDGSGIVCDEYAEKDNRISVIHQTNQGLSAARNYGLDIMTGDVIAFLDSDDAYHPQFVQLMLEAMIQNYADIVVCRYSVRYENNNMINNRLEIVRPSMKSGLYNRVSALQSLAEMENNYVVWNKLYKKDLWKSIRFTTGHIHEDLDVIYKIFDISNIIFVLDNSLYLYRKHRGSISETISVRNFTDLIQSYSNFYSFIEMNTPKVYSQFHSERISNEIAQKMVQGYVFFHNLEGRQEQLLCENLRRQLARKKRKTRNEHLHIKVACYIISRHPLLFSPMYKLYHFLHNIIDKLFLWCS